MGPPPVLRFISEHIIAHVHAYCFPGLNPRFWLCLIKPFIATKTMQISHQLRWEGVCGAKRWELNPSCCLETQSSPGVRRCGSCEVSVWPEVRYRLYPITHYAWITSALLLPKTADTGYQRRQG